jgi:pantoate--beta-alanine ligase
MNMSVVRTTEDLRRTIALWRIEGAKIALVPTMGALHQGHLSLVDTALQRADRVIVSIFVNPRQLNDPADFAAYPRSENRDAQLLRDAGAHVAYCPPDDEIYPETFSTRISVAGVSDGLCGAHRPSHFDGVATVVTKLLLQTQADYAYFGEKDFQQLQVIRRLVTDLGISTRIMACPTVREADGLAMSSRNKRLSKEERATAPALSQILFQTARGLSAEADVAHTLERARKELKMSGFRKIEYLELCGEHDLRPLRDVSRPARLLAAVWLGDTRLIDNVQVLGRS